MSALTEASSMCGSHGSAGGKQWAQGIQTHGSGICIERKQLGEPRLVCELAATYATSLGATFCSNMGAIGSVSVQIGNHSIM